MLKILLIFQQREQGNRKTRKRIDLEHTSQATPEAKSVKLADLIHNSGSITKYDSNFSKTYMNEKRELLKVLKEGNEKLYIKLHYLLKTIIFLWRKSNKPTRYSKVLLELKFSTQLV